MDKRRPGKRLRMVIDTSVVAKWIIPGEAWEQEARAVADDVVLGYVEANAPSLLLHELASVLAKAIRAGKITLQDSLAALQSMKFIGINIHEINWDESVEIVKIAELTKLTIYDSTYLYLARKIEGALITADNEIKTRGKAIAKIITLAEY